MLSRPTRTALPLRLLRWTRQSSTSAESAGPSKPPAPPPTGKDSSPPALALRPKRTVRPPKVAIQPAKGFTPNIIHGSSLLPAPRLAPTHRIPVALVHFRSHFPHLLDLATNFVSHTAHALAVPASHPIPLPTKRSLWTVPKGPFAHKKSQENYERKTYKRVIKAWDANRTVVDKWLAYVHLHAVPGVGMRVVRWYRVPVGFGRGPRLTEEMAKRRHAQATTKEKVQKLAKEVLEAESKAMKNQQEKIIVTA